MLTTDLIDHQLGQVVLRRNVVVQRQISATINILAQPLQVWAILIDLDRYPEWNPLFREAVGEVAVGKRLTLKSFPAQGRAMTVRPRVIAVEPGAELRWTASLPGIMSGEHSFVLSQVDGGTRLVHCEALRGLLVPFSGKILARAEASLAELSEALERRAEAD